MTQPHMTTAIQDKLKVAAQSLQTQPSETL